MIFYTLFKDARVHLAKRKRYNQLVSEINSLSDRDLAALGFAEGGRRPEYRPATRANLDWGARTWLPSKARPGDGRRDERSEQKPRPTSSRRRRPTRRAHSTGPFFEGDWGLRAGFRSATTPSRTTRKPTSGKES